MNIFELIEPINLSNQVKTDSLAKQKRALSVSITRRRPAYSFMSSRMSTKSYNDNFIETPVTPQTRKNSNGPVNKSLASRTRFEIMVPDLNKLTTETDRYKFVMSASREVLDKIEPGMYFGIRVGPAFKPDDQQLIYDFDSNAIYRRVNNDYDSFIAYDPRNVYIMLDKNNYKNVFVDTKNYIPILHNQLISADDLYEDEEEEEEYDDLVPYNPGLNPREDNIREQAAKEHQRKQFNQHVQDLQDVYEAVENERLPADEDEAMDDELPPPRKGRPYKPVQPVQPAQPEQPAPPAQPEQPAQPGMPQSAMQYYITHIAPRMQEEQEEQEEQDEQDDFIPYDDEKQYMIKLLNIKQTQRREVIEERIIKNFERFFDYLVRKREKSGEQTTRENEIGILFDTYRNKWKNFAYDSLKQFASFLSKYKRDPKIASMGLETLKLMNIENFDLNLQVFLKNFI